MKRLYFLGLEYCLELGFPCYPAMCLGKVTWQMTTALLVLPLACNGESYLSYERKLCRCLSEVPKASLESVVGLIAYWPLEFPWARSFNKSNFQWEF